jgi:hypothetical protein
VSFSPAQALPEGNQRFRAFSVPGKHNGSAIVIQNHCQVTMPRAYRYFIYRYAAQSFQRWRAVFSYKPALRVFLKQLLLFHHRQ